MSATSGRLVTLLYMPVREKSPGTGILQYWSDIQQNEMIGSTYSSTNSRWQIKRGKLAKLCSRILILTSFMTASLEVETGEEKERA